MTRDGKGNFFVDEVCIDFEGRMRSDSGGVTPPVYNAMYSFPNKLHLHGEGERDMKEGPSKRKRRSSAELPTSDPTNPQLK